MELIKKIDHRLFWPLSMIVTLGFCFLAKGMIEILVIVGVYIATLISLFMMMLMLHSLILGAKNSVRQRKKDLFFYMMLHVLFLFGSIALGVHFVGNRIIIAVLNYIAQIFVLGLGLRKSLKN